MAQAHGSSADSTTEGKQASLSRARSPSPRSPRPSQDGDTIPARIAEKLHVRFTSVISLDGDSEADLGSIPWLGVEYRPMSGRMRLIDSTLVIVLRNGEEEIEL